MEGKKIYIGPKRVNRAHWPTKENKQHSDVFWIFPAHAKNGPRWAQMGPGGFFPTNLADILGRTDLDFENFYFLDFFGSQISGLGPPTWAQLGPTHLDFQTPPALDEFSNPDPGPSQHTQG